MNEYYRKRLKLLKLKQQYAKPAINAAKPYLWLPHLMMALLLLLLAIGLTACQSAPEVVERVVQLPPPKVPGELLAPCEGSQKPVGKWTQKTLVLIADEFKEALDLCNADKAAIKKILNQ